MLHEWTNLNTGSITPPSDGRLASMCNIYAGRTTSYDYAQNTKQSMFVADQLPSNVRSHHNNSTPCHSYETHTPISLIYVMFMFYFYTPSYMPITHSLSIDPPTLPSVQQFSAQSCSASVACQCAARHVLLHTVSRLTVFGAVSCTLQPLPTRIDTPCHAVVSHMSQMPLIPPLIFPLTTRRMLRAHRVVRLVGVHPRPRCAMHSHQQEP